MAMRKWKKVRKAVEWGVLESPATRPTGIKITPEERANSPLRRADSKVGQMRPPFYCDCVVLPDGMEQRGEVCSERDLRAWHESMRKWGAYTKTPEYQNFINKIRSEWKDGQ